MHAFRFKSDDTINSKGFSASYTIIDQADNKVKRREMTTFNNFSVPHKQFIFSNVKGTVSPD